MLDDIDIYFDIRVNDIDKIKSYKKEINFENVNEEKDTLLHYAVKCNSFDCCRFFIKFIPVNSKNAFNETPLFYAARLGKIELVKLLIRYGVDVNLKNNNGETALMMALIKGNLDVIKLLIEENADTNVVTNDNLTIAHYAIKGGSINNFSYLHKKNYININQKDQNNNTLLHYATKTNNLKLIKYLLKFNFVNQKNIFKETPLFNSCRNEYVDSIKLLVLNGAIIELENKYGETIRDVSSKKINLELDELTEKVFYKNRYKKYPQIIAIIKEDVEYLKQVKISNIKDNYGLYTYDYIKFIDNEEITKLIK